MYQPYSGTARMLESAELSRPGVVRRRPVSEPARPRALVVKIPVTCGRGELAVPGPVSAGGWLTGVQLAAGRAARPAAPIVLEGAHHDEWIAGCTGAEAVAARFSLPRRAQ